MKRKRDCPFLSTKLSAGKFLYFSVKYLLKLDLTVVLVSWAFKPSSCTLSRISLTAVSSNRYLNIIFNWWVPSGHHVVQVNELDEGFNLWALLDLLGSHSSGDSSGLTLNADDQGVSEFSVLIGLFISAQQNSLSATETSSSYNNESSWFQTILLTIKTYNLPIFFPIRYLFF